MRKNNQWKIQDIYSGESRGFNIGTKRSFKRAKLFFGGLIKGGLTVLISVSIIFTIVKAGSITPPGGEPSSKFYTLSEIYNLITANTTISASHSFDFSASLAGTHYTLSDIYNALAGLVDPTKVLSGITYLGTAGTMVDNDAFSLTASVSNQSVTAGYYSGGTLLGDANLVAGKIKSGVSLFNVTGDYPSAANKLPGDTGATDATVTEICNGNEAWTSAGALLTGTFSPAAASISVGNTYCGTAGTLLANLFNGTSGAFTGGSQANGGADDYNNAGSPASDRYEKGWTACNAGNSYCGTSDTGADAKDDSTGLIWSMPCNGSGCASFSDASPITYSWDSSAVNNNSRTASQLCSDHTGWSLPHQKQLMQAYIDGSYGNLEASGVSYYYWSATTESNDPPIAWLINLSFGTTTITSKTIAFYVRCVR